MDVVMLVLLITLIVLIGIAVNKLKPYDDLTKEFAHINMIFVLITYTTLLSITGDSYNFFVLNNTDYPVKVHYLLEVTLLPFAALNRLMIFVYLMYKDA